MASTKVGSTSSTAERIGEGVRSASTKSSALSFQSPAATAKPGSPILAKPSARCSAIRKRTRLGPARRYRSRFKVLLPSLTVFFPALPMTRFEISPKTSGALSDDELAAIISGAKLTVVRCQPSKSWRTRFICARKSWHVDHRGEIRATERDSDVG